MNILTVMRRCSEGQRAGIISIPFDKIETIESQIESEQVFCKVNGIEVQHSYWEVMCVLDMQEVVVR